MAEFVLIRLKQNVKEKGYNVKVDNFFTSLAAAEKLRRNKISIVGTIRKNCRELSQQMAQPMRNELYSSHFWWHEGSNAMFVKYSTKTKQVCVLPLNNAFCVR